MNDHSKSVFLSLFSALVLSACGGGSGQPENQNNTPSEPIQIIASSWQDNQTRARSTGNTSLKTNSSRFNEELYFYGYGLGDLTNKHWQIHFDMDNNPTTGYQFKDEAWSGLSGIDYIIEDGVIYKSTANDSSWSWKNIGSSSLISASDADLYQQGQVRFKFNAYNKGLCQNFKVGIVTMDQNWKIETFYPVATELLKQTTTFCENNHPPVVKLNQGHITLEIGDTYTDPGATATDEEDGDLTSKIITSSRRLNEMQTVPGIHIDTSKRGSYLIVYSVTDSGGKKSRAIRNVFIKKPSHLNDIIIDGNNQDWNGITALAVKPSYANLKVTDDKEFLYLQVSAKTFGNTQFFIDTDNNARTGFQVTNGAADYLIENSSFSKFTGTNQNQWAWKYNYKPIEIKTKVVRGAYGRPLRRIVEMAIPKTAIHNLGNKISIGFSSLDNNWNEKYAMPDPSGTLITYQLKYPVINVNQAPNAVDDTHTTYSARPGTKNFIPILDNDSDPEGDALSITQVTQPLHGQTGISTAQGTPQNTVWYTPRLGYTGSDSFTYTIKDTHGNTATATVTMTVTRSNRAPNAVEDAPTTTSDTPINIDVLLNDSDPDGNHIRILSFTQPAYGVVTEVSISGPSSASRRRHLRFDPQGHVGSITFSYTISDGRTLSPNHTDTTTVTVASTSPTDTTHTGWPVIKNENITVKKGQYIMIDVLANDFDPDGDTLILDQVDSGGHGMTTRIHRKVRYTPVAGFTGHDEFWYGVHDGYGHNGAGRVSITVVP